MNKLESFLQQHGFATLNVNYPSTRLDMAGIVDHLHTLLSPVIVGHPGLVHFIGYSMGGLVIRGYLTRYRPATLGHVVMLGTPHGGSEVADFLKNIWLYKKIYGPAGQQLTTTSDYLTSLCTTIDYPLGILAGSRSLDPLSSWLIGQPNDGKVSIASTKIAGMKDHRTLPVTHTFFPSNKHVWNETLYFLQNGTFTPTSS